MCSGRGRVGPTRSGALGGRALLALMAGTMVASPLTSLGVSPAAAQGISMDVAPVDVTARQRRPVVRPRRAAPAVRAVRAPRPPVVRLAAPPVPAAPAVQPLAGGTPAAPGALPGPGGPGNGRLARDNPVGPVNGYVANTSATGTKTNTPLIETPQSITVIGRQQIDAQKAQTVQETLRYAAGVYPGAYGPATRTDFFLIRGFTAQDTGLYKDGLQLLQYGFGGYQVDPFGIERIDVLRGPAAVLFGQGGPGGIVNLISKRPTADPFGYVEAGGGSFGQKYAAFDFGGPLDKDGTLFYRMTGIGRQGGTQTFGTDDDRGYIAPSFTYKPDGATTFTVLTAVERDLTGRINSFLPYSGTVRPQALGLRIPRQDNINDPGANQYTRNQAYAGYEFEHHFNDVFTVRQNLRYSFSEASDAYFSSTTYANAQQTLLNRSYSRNQGRSRLFNVDTQGEARFDDGFFRHTLLVGVDYKDYQLNQTQASGTPVASFNILNPNYNTATPPLIVRTKSYSAFDQVGLYAQDQIRLTDRLSLIASGRGDFTANDVTNRLNPRLSTTQTANVATQRYALIYNFDSGLAPYVSYGSYFTPTVGTNVFGEPYKPITGDQYEAGVKYQPPGADYFITAAAFDLSQANTQVTDPTNNQNTIQIGQVRSRGFEAQFVANVTKDFNIVAGFTNYNLETTRGTVAEVGNTPAGRPETFASLFADYTIPTGPLAGFGFGGGVRYVGRSFADTANTLRVPEYVLFDTVVHYVRDNWRFAVNAANIADKRFVSACIGVNSCFYGDARRVTASLSYRW